MIVYPHNVNPHVHISGDLYLMLFQVSHVALHTQFIMTILLIPLHNVQSLCTKQSSHKPGII